MMFSQQETEKFFYLANYPAGESSSSLSSSIRYRRRRRRRRLSSLWMSMKQQSIYLTKLNQLSI